MSDQTKTDTPWLRWHPFWVSREEIAAGVVEDRMTTDPTGKPALQVRDGISSAEATGDDLTSSKATGIGIPASTSKGHAGSIPPMSEVVMRDSPAECAIGEGVRHSPIRLPEGARRFVFPAPQPPKTNLPRAVDLWRPPLPRMWTFELLDQGGTRCWIRVD